MARSKEPKSHSFKNLTFTDHKPKFLTDIQCALRGGTSQPIGLTPARTTDQNGDTTEILDPNRPAIPVRPSASTGSDDEDAPQIVDGLIQADAGFGRISDGDDELDDEAPQVVVVKQGRDLTFDQFQAEKTRIREHPDQISSLPTSSRPTIQASLQFSSSNSGASSSSTSKKRRATGKEEHQSAVDQISTTIFHSKIQKEEDGANWTSLVKRTKGNQQTSMILTIQEERERDEQLIIQKKEKKAALKAKNKKAKSLMSFS